MPMRWQLIGIGLACCLGLSAFSGGGLADGFVPQTTLVPGGRFVLGSDQTEREYGYRLDEAGYGHSRTRQNAWYSREPDRQTATLPAFLITITPITNAQYQSFTSATGHPVPDVDAASWAGYRLVHPYSRTRRFAWTGGEIPQGRAAHPVVLVSYSDAVAYAAWLSRITGKNWHLPSEWQWEKAARGADGRMFPWGDDYDPARLNSHDAGPFDTVAVGHYPQGASPYGVLDMAGNVFEWTSTPAGSNHHIVKGGSWDDKGCGVCRPAARHSRPDGLKHILVGFRLVREVTE